MNEQRLVTIILWVVLVMGSMGLIVIYLVTSGDGDMQPAASSTGQTVPELSGMTDHVSPSFPAPASPEAVAQLKDKPQEQPVAVPDDVVGTDLDGIAKKELPLPPHPSRP